MKYIYLLTLLPFLSVPNLTTMSPTTIPRHLSSPSLQTSYLGWSTSTCTALMVPCMDLSTTHCPILMSATFRKAKKPWIHCTSATVLRFAGGKLICSVLFYTLSSQMCRVECVVVQFNGIVPNHKYKQKSSRSL